MEDWTERYRPNRLEDIVGQDDIVRALIKYSENQNFPRLLFVGDSGTGKTTAAIALAKSLWKRPDFLELNASDERGIDVIRYDVYSYARSRSSLGAPFKVLILDECESLTPEAQRALRRMVEKWHKNCKFILICNELLPIIPALQSRTTPFEFHSINKKEIIKVLKRICKEEEVDYEKSQLLEIAKDCGGDLRSAVEMLQTVAEGRDEIDESTLRSITNPSGYGTIEKMVTLSMNGELNKALSVFARGSKFISSRALNKFIRDQLFTKDSLFDEEEKSNLAIALSELRTSYISRNQLLGLLARIYQSSSPNTDDED